MIGAIARKLFGSSNDRRIKGYMPRVRSDQRAGKGARRALGRGAQGQDRGVQEAGRRGGIARRHPGAGLRHLPRGAKRTSGQRHFDVQLIGGMILHEGRISEMKTGEGKTLVATLPVYLNALAGRGVHVVTVNDYLAKPRRRVDGTDLQFPRPRGRRHRARPGRRAAQAGLRRRRDLRHQQRARLRLPARQHEVPARGHGAARAHLRHRRRGRLDPDRRGQDAADHLRVRWTTAPSSTTPSTPISPSWRRPTTKSTRSSARWR